MGGGSEIPLKPVVDDAQVLPIRILTHNIRYAATYLFKGEKPWPKRLPGLLKELHHYSSVPFNPSTTIICLQEVLHAQLQDVVSGLGHEWSSVGIGRDDGKTAGEYEPIFYRNSVWEKIHFETIWLSETPHKPGKGWDAASVRVCTCLVLKHRDHSSTTGHPANAGRTFMFLNTHLDDQGRTARRNGAKLIAEYAKRWRKQFNVDKYVLAGDLNSEIYEKQGAWEVLNGENSGFIDSYRLLLQQGDGVLQYGNDNTYTGFDGCGDGYAITRIDFVHLGTESNDSNLSNNVQDRLCTYAVLPNIFDDGVRFSDHRAVVVDLLL